MLICPKCLAANHGIHIVHASAPRVLGTCDECGTVTSTVEISSRDVLTLPPPASSSCSADPAPAGNPDSSTASAEPVTADALAQLVARNQEQLNALAQQVTALRQTMAAGAASTVHSSRRIVQEGVDAASNLASKGADFAADVLQNGMDAVGAVIDTGFAVLGALVQGVGNVIGCLTQNRKSGSDSNSVEHYRQYQNSAREGF